MQILIIVSAIILIITTSIVIVADRNITSIEVTIKSIIRYLKKQTIAVTKEKELFEKKLQNAEDERSINAYRVGVFTAEQKLKLLEEIKTDIIDFYE